MEVMRMLERVGSESGATSVAVTIGDCGQLASNSVSFVDDEVHSPVSPAKSGEMRAAVVNTESREGGSASGVRPTTSQQSTRK